MNIHFIIIEKFIIKGNKIFLKLNKGETQKKEMCKICNYFTNYNKYIFTHKEIRRKSEIITNKKSFNSKKRHRAQEFENFEALRNTIFYFYLNNC